MSLAYITETRSGTRGGSLLILAWAGCQFFRGASLHLIEAGGVGIALIGVFAFLDKYTGPLGSSALDKALLQILEFGALRGSDATRYTVPSTILWTSRMVVSKVERPMCQLVLLHTNGVPVERLAWTFTLASTAAVLAVHRGRHDCLAQAGASPGDLKK